MTIDVKAFLTGGSIQSPSSQNALKTGLFTARDFIRTGEEEEYAEALVSLMRELSPEGVLEETFAAEIAGARWRLRRCRLIEAALALRVSSDLTLDEQDEKRQKSVDRARAQSHNILRRSLAELRKLQTQRAIRRETAIAPAMETAGHPSAPTHGDAAFKALLAQLENMQRENAACSDDTPSNDEDISFCESEKPQPAASGSFCKSAAPMLAPRETTPRNAPCPCRSGLKFKRCCANSVAPVQKTAA